MFIGFATIILVAASIVWIMRPEIYQSASTLIHGFPHENPTSTPTPTVDQPAPTPQPTTVAVANEPAPTDADLQKLIERAKKAPVSAAAQAWGNCMVDVNGQLFPKNTPECTGKLVHKVHRHRPSFLPLPQLPEVATVSVEALTLGEILAQPVPTETFSLEAKAELDESTDQPSFSFFAVTDSEDVIDDGNIFQLDPLITAVTAPEVETPIPAPSSVSVSATVAAEQPSVPEPAKVKLISNQEESKPLVKRTSNYEIRVFISDKDANDKKVAVGSYPVEVFANQNEHRQYTRTIKGTMLCKPGQDATSEPGLLCSYISATPPPKHGMILTNLGSGPMPIPDEYVAEYQPTNDPVLKPLKRKAYKAIEHSLPTKPSKKMAIMRLLFPMLPQATMAAFNPIMGIPFGMSVFSNVLHKKYGDNSAAIEAIAHPSEYVDHALDEQDVNIQKVKDDVNGRMADHEERLQRLEELLNLKTDDPITEEVEK